MKPCPSAEFSIRPVEPGGQTAALAAMAERIWTEHYRPIIGEEQTRYMVDRFQSAPAIERQLAQGYRYFFLLSGGREAGYFAVAPEPDALFLSKLYVEKGFRRRGLARRAVAAAAEMARQAGRDRLRLTVNRNNAGSVAAYERMGFVRVREQKADIGGGFFMDDFVYELSV